MNAPRDFSAIARSLLLSQPREEIHSAHMGEASIMGGVAERRVPGCLCAALQSISLDMLGGHEECSVGTRRHFTPDTKAVIASVRQFFAKLKEHLGDTARGTVFDSVNAITATACGVSLNTAQRVSNSPVPREITRVTRTNRSRKVAVVTAMNNLGAVWGERIKRVVHEMLKEERDVTIGELRHEMVTLHPDFKWSPMTLWRLVKGLGFSYKIIKGQRYIFERSDIARKRSLYLKKIDDARRRGDCVVYMDETWVFEGMVKRRGWVDNTMSRFPSAAEIQQYSCGKTAGKNKGRRGIVITALCEGGMIPGCTHVFVSGHRTAQDDSNEMDHVKFEDWLQSSLPLMINFAAGRNVTLVLDNAPYHTRALEKVPTSRSTKQDIVSYLRQHGVEVAIDSTKSSLLEELDHFVASRGGAASLRCFAAERICREMGVTLLRLPPFHCYFNPVELCWSFLKHKLNKMGRPSDRLETVKMRVSEILRTVPSQLCEGWCREALREEDTARLKEALDFNNNSVENEDSSSSSPASSDSSLTDDMLSEHSIEL